MTKKVISVSRRTDIPAFYGDWFMNRIKDGFASYVNPIGGQKYIIPLKLEDVLCFVFWSKNFEPFLPKLIQIEKLGYKFYFNFTITGLPKIFECNLCDIETSLKTIKILSKSYSPKHINWRYDPIILSNITDYNYHLKHFEFLASSMEGYIERCYFSFVIQYGLVKRNFDQFQSDNKITIDNPNKELTIKLANDLAVIGNKYGIQMLTCSGDYLLTDKIGKAHCIDGNIIDKLFPSTNKVLAEKPTRDQCGCTVSTDIGAYDTCPHGCIYCYANINKEKANKRYKEHDILSAFLGYSKEQSDIWLAEINAKKQLDNKQNLPTLFG